MNGWYISKKIIFRSIYIMLQRIILRMLKLIGDEVDIFLVEKKIGMT